MVSPIAQKVDRVAVLAIAYHNIGVEQEFLKRLDQSLHSYRKGKRTSSIHYQKQTFFFFPLLKTTKQQTIKK